MRTNNKLILVASGIAKGVIVQSAKQTGGEHVDVQSMSDMQAAITVQDGKADYFIGSCSTGQGGALSMARAILGEEKCVLLTEQGRMLDSDIIHERASSDYRAFGVSADLAADVIPILVRTLLEKHQNTEV